MFGKTNNMVSVYYNERQFSSVSMNFFTTKAGLVGNKIVDSSGMKYTTKNTCITGSSGFGQEQDRVISVKYEYEDAGMLITPEELKAMLLECFPKSKWLRPAWNNIKTFQSEIDGCNDFSQLASLFRRLSGSITEQMKLYQLKQL
jgi:hypothetical protein